MARERPFGGINIFGLRTAERPRGVGAPTLPPPTRETSLSKATIDGIIRTEKTKTPPKKPNGIKVLVSRGILAGLTLTAIGVGVNKVLSDDEPTPQTRSVDSSGPTSFNGEFDKNADKQTVTAGKNAKSVSDEEAIQLTKDNPPQLKKGDFPTLPLVFIGKLKDGEKATIDTHYVDQAYNPIAKKPDRLNSGRYIEFEKAGTELGLSFEEYEVFQIDPFVHKDGSHFAGVVVRFSDPKGIPHTVIIQTPEDIRHLAPADIIKNAPTVGKNGKLTNTYYEEIKNKKGVVVNGPETILTTIKDNAKVRIGGAAILDEYPRGLVEKIIFVDQNNQMVFPK